MIAVVGKGQNNNYDWLNKARVRYLPIIPKIENYKEIYDDLNWIMKDGRIIKIKNMSSSHLKQCIDKIIIEVGSCEKAEKYKVYSNLVDEYCIRLGKEHLVRN